MVKLVILITFYFGTIFKATGFQRKYSIQPAKTTEVLL